MNTSVENKFYVIGKGPETRKKLLVPLEQTIKKLKAGEKITVEEIKEPPEIFFNENRDLLACNPNVAVVVALDNLIIKNNSEAWGVVSDSILKQFLLLASIGKNYHKEPRVILAHTKEVTQKDPTENPKARSMRGEFDDSTGGFVLTPKDSYDLNESFRIVVESLRNQERHVSLEIPGIFNRGPF